MKEIKTKCSKKLKTPITGISSIDKGITYIGIVKLSRSYSSNYELLDYYTECTGINRIIPTAIDAFDIMSHRFKDDCTFS